MDPIYPKALVRSRFTPKPNQCFVLMPFRPEFETVYAEITDAMREINFNCLRADDMDVNRPIITNIISEILASHFIIADLTTRNPNVFYEVGIAHSLRDLVNVILLAQSMEDVPFDLRHLPVIIYDQTNLRGLRVRLTRRILENRYVFTGQVYIREHFGSQFDQRTLDEMIEFINSSDTSLWTLLMDALADPKTRPEPKELARGVRHLREELGSLAHAGRLNILRALFTLFKEVLRRHSDNPRIADYLEATFSSGRPLDVNIDEHTTSALMIDLATGLYATENYRRHSLQWLIGYLARPKVAGVDILRSRVEHFFLSTNDHDVHEALIVSLSHSNSSLREAAADLIGEMRLEAAARDLIEILPRETSPYVARSIFSALGKIATSEAAGPILQWVRENQLNIGTRGWDFIPDHARSALQSIDRRNGTNHVRALTQPETKSE